MEFTKAGWELIVAGFQLLLVNVELGALVVGTLAAISITQVVKMLVIQYAPTNGTRALWYSMTTLVGFTVTFMNWPTRLGASWGLVVGGVLAPAIYIIGTRILYRFFPDAEAKISSSPRAPR